MFSSKPHSSTVRFFFDKSMKISTVPGFADLSSDFYTVVPVAPLEGDRVLHVNEQLASTLGVSSQDRQSQDFDLFLKGRQLLNEARPYSTVYSGHQFGVWAGQLGDGRAHTVATVSTPQSNIELQLKGSGHTPYSRMGDGRAALRSSIREYLASYAMKGLRIPTTDVLSLTTSTEQIQRELLEPAAMVMRTAPSFVRFGHFQHWLAANRPDNIEALMDFVCRSYLREEIPNYDSLDVVGRALAFLKVVIRRTAELIAQWQLVGFVHGVMNTDNMSVLGLTIDYGPYGFMDDCVIDWVCNHSDHHGRYAFHQQPGIALWNLYQFAACFQPLGASKEAMGALLAEYETVFFKNYRGGMALKLGLSEVKDADPAFFDAFWELLHRQGADFTQAFRRLNTARHDPQRWLKLFVETDSAQSWLKQYLKRLELEDSPDDERMSRMNQINPEYILRNHLAQKVIEDVERGSTDLLQRAINILQDPFHIQYDAEWFSRLPNSTEKGLGLSCSS